MRKLLLLVSLLFAVSATAQELNCTVVVNAQLTGGQNIQVFKTLERQLKEFVNNTQWTNKSFSQQERIECSMVINVQEYSGDTFKASLQVSSSRPVFNSTYSTPVYNYNDRNFNFQYLEFQNLVFNPTQFESNLVSVLTYHIYMILGMDADTFEDKGGDDYFSQAQTITNYSQQGNFKGWKPEDGQQSRYMLIDNVLSPTFSDLRSVMYNYHRLGLDVMAENSKKGKEAVAMVFNQLKNQDSKRPNSYAVRVFFDAKADEIESIFSDGPSVNVAQIIDILNNIAPTHAAKWRNISF